MKYKSIRNLVAVGLGVAVFGSLSIGNAQDIPAPKDVAAAPKDAVKTASGLASKVLKVGTGKEKPGAADTVTVHYTGWDKTGKMFDSSVKRGQPASFPLNQVIKGWTEGLQLMVVGEKRRFWIPSKLAYGDQGRVAGDLCFEVELLGIKKAPEAPKVPANLTAPKDAVKTASGLASKVLKAGTGTEKPAAADQVTVHYSGWDKAGKMFDSSVMRGQPATFDLNGVIKGWTEGVQLMVVGEKRRFWIPADLAYGKVPQRPGAPAGDLCFDVELLNIKKAPVMPKVPANLTAPADAVKTASGLASKVLTKGTGTEKPTADDTVTVHYSGWDKTGKMFDSSIMRGQTATFPLNGVIKGWTEGVQLMVVGEKRRFWIPAKMAYGEVPQRPGAPSGDLVFDVELVKIKKGLKMPDVPKDVATPPATAIVSEGDIKSVVLKEGKGAQPKASDVISVHYTGWSKDGKVVDSSAPSGEAMPLPIANLSPGFAKALQLMKVGETRQFWIPLKHIVGDNPRPGTPPGPFCYQFELVEIVKPK